MVTVERLYELYNTIAEAKDASKHEAEFEEILTGVKGAAPVRRMTAQFISRYFATFPNQEEKALNALFDICEDDDSTIRRQAISTLGVVCRGKPALVPKVADILAQLLQMDDPGELNCVNAALVALLRIHAKGALTGIFYQLDYNKDEVIRERVLQFLLSKVQALNTTVFTKDVQCTVFTEAKKFIPTASEDELVLILSILSELSVCRTVNGQQQLVDLLLAQVDLTKPMLELPHITKTLSILTQAKNFFSNSIRPTAVVAYLLTHCLPYLDQVEAAVLVAGQDAAAVTLQLLKLVAQLINYAETVEQPKPAMTQVFKALLEVLPLPPAEGQAGWEDGGASLQFSRVECLLYTLHQLIKHSKEDFFSDADALKDFRLRLQYFARGSQAYQKVLREALQGKKGEELKTEENKIKLIALKTTANINTLIKDFFHSPPAAKSTILLSWMLDSGNKPATTGAPAVAVGFKRHAQITVDEDTTTTTTTTAIDTATATKQTKTSRQIYAPPRDKFSKGQGFTASTRGGRGRGTGRGFRRIGY